MAARGMGDFTLLVLAVSLLLQVGAAAMALRLSRLTGWTTSSMGFGARLERRQEHSIGDLLVRIEPSDLLEFGLIPEFVGRLPVIAPQSSDVSKCYSVKTTTWRFQEQQSLLCMNTVQRETTRRHSQMFLLGTQKWLYFLHSWVPAFAGMTLIFFKCQNGRENHTYDVTKRTEL